MKPTKAELKKAKNLLNKYAPKGEELAYINSKEATLLKKMGGAGKDINGTGIKSYFDPGSGRGSVSESLSEAAGLGSTGPSNDGGGNNSGGDNPYEGIASRPSPQNILSKAGSGIVDYIKTGGTIGLIARTVGKAINYVTKNIGGRMTRTQVNTNQARLSGSQIFDYQKKSMPSTTMGGGDSGNDNSPASNVGGKIIKLAPTSAEISQSKATDVTYDSRKTKARGRSMTIRTNSRGVGNNMASVLGKKSLLGAA